MESEVSSLISLLDQEAVDWLASTPNLNFGKNTIYLSQLKTSLEASGLLGATNTRQMEAE